MRPGLQLYTLSDRVNEDLETKLTLIASLGFQEVELAGLEGRSAKEVRKAIADAGLTCRSGHLIFFGQPEIDANIEAAHELGLKYLVAAVPWKPDLTGIEPDPEGGPYAFALSVVNSLTLEDWKWNADLFNKTGDRLRAAGLQFAYHNHNIEFRDLGGVCGFDEILRLTDPELVKLELDPGWIRVAGRDPVEFLQRCGNRTRLLHVRDFAPGFEQTTRLSLAHAPTPAPAGSGAVDFASLIPAAIRAGVEGFFVEREPHADNPAAIAKDCAWLKALLRQ